MGLSPNDSTKAYVQIADDLRRQIRAGEYGPGDKLPSTSELVKKYDVANMTVQGAIRLLREEKLIYGIQGRGTFVREDFDPAQLDRSSGPSDEYVELRDDLRSLAGAVDQLAKRVDGLESQLAPKATGRSAKRPAR
jgi:GntR family transcriptional regulator